MEKNEYYFEKTKILIGFLLMALSCAFMVGKIVMYEKSKMEKYPRATTEQIMAMHQSEACCDKQLVRTTNLMIFSNLIKK